MVFLGWSFCFDVLFVLFQVTAKAAVVFVTLQYNVTIPATGILIDTVFRCFSSAVNRIIHALVLFYLIGQF